MPRLFRGEDALPFDGAAALARLRKDRALARLIDRVGGLRLQVHPAPSPYEALAESIVYQQLTGKAAATIFGRLQALGPEGRLPGPADLLALPEGALRGAGLSRPKQAALRDLAEKTLAGLVPAREALEALPDSAIVDTLTQVRGIGRWTVEMLLIFNLGRPDVLPVADYGLRKGYMRTFGTPDLPRPAEVAARGERWRPYRSAASWYLWRASELPDAPILLD
ncbi:MAG: DNA-3-methyladenine glycosylase 2 family protein [Candidatus Sericytochromatia bacterium]|nr:DNA-3-methyladenine glycosylase 2 family protein [Candidatus Tanganyikabacteria bacterium]